LVPLWNGPRSPSRNCSSSATRRLGILCGSPLLPHANPTFAVTFHRRILVENEDRGDRWGKEKEKERERKRWDFYSSLFSQRSHFDVLRPVFFWWEKCKLQSHCFVTMMMSKYREISPIFQLYRLLDIS